eukprot:2148139-Amphidinium_carterae.1
MPLALQFPHREGKGRLQDECRRLGPDLLIVSSLADSRMQARKSMLTSMFWCMIYGSGIIATLLVYGLLQDISVPIQLKQLQEHGPR